MSEGGYMEGRERGKGKGRCTGKRKEGRKQVERPEKTKKKEEKTEGRQGGMGKDGTGGKHGGHQETQKNLEGGLLLPLPGTVVKHNESRAPFVRPWEASATI